MISFINTGVRVMLGQDCLSAFFRKQLPRPLNWVKVGFRENPEMGLKSVKIDTKYDRAKVPPYNGHDPPPAPGRLKTLLFPPLLNKVQNKGTQGVQARYGAELPPLISIVWCPGRPVILGMDKSGF